MAENVANGGRLGYNSRGGFNPTGNGRRYILYASRYGAFVSSPLLAGETGKARVLLLLPVSLSPTASQPAFLPRLPRRRRRGNGFVKALSNESLSRGELFRIQPAPELPYFNRDTRLKRRKSCPPLRPLSMMGERQLRAEISSRFDRISIKMLLFLFFFWTRKALHLTFSRTRIFGRRLFGEYLVSKKKKKRNVGIAFQPRRGGCYANKRVFQVDDSRHYWVCIPKRIGMRCEWISTHQARLLHGGLDPPTFALLDLKALIYNIYTRCRLLPAQTRASCYASTTLLHCLLHSISILFPSSFTERLAAEFRVFLGSVVAHQIHQIWVFPILDSRLVFIFFSLQPHLWSLFSWLLLYDASCMEKVSSGENNALRCIHALSQAREWIFLAAADQARLSVCVCAYFIDQTIAAASMRRTRESFRFLFLAAFAIKRYTKETIGNKSFVFSFSFLFCHFPLFSTFQTRVVACFRRVIDKSLQQEKAFRKLNCVQQTAAICTNCAG